MRARLEAGAAVSALFLALGVLATGQDWCPAIAIGLFVLAGLALLTAFASRLPLVHKIPLVGAPRLSATLKIDGRRDATLRIPKEEPRDALIEVGVHNPDRQDVNPAHINLLMTEGIRRWKTDHNGRPDSAGKWMRPTIEAIGEDDPTRYKDYWADSRGFPGDNDAVWWFRLRFKRPGDYRFRLKISSSVLYREFKKDFRVLVSHIDGEPTTAEKIDALLDQGEKMLISRPDVYSGDTARQDYLAWIVAVVQVIPEDSYVQLFRDRTAEDTNPDPDDYFRDELGAGLDVLYEIRRRLVE